MSTTKNLNETFTVQSNKCKYTDENIISDFKWVAIYDGPSKPFYEFRAEKKVANDDEQSNVPPSGYVSESTHDDCR